MSLPSEIRVLTVRQPWAWAIIHGGKAARLIAFALSAGRIGTCPVNESQDTPSAERHASAHGRPTSERSAASARPTPTTLPKLAQRMSSSAETADTSAPRARCLARSRASASRARLLEHVPGLRRTRTSGSDTAASPTSSGPTASHPSSTTTCSPRRAACAQSAVRPPKIRAAIACTSITAMTQAGCAASSAAAATAAWATSATTSPALNRRSATSRRRSTAIGGA